MKLVALAIRRPVSIVVFFVALVVFGLISFPQLPVDLLPNLTFPTITIRTEYPGVAPHSVEDFVTAPIEEAVSTLSGVTDISSVSRAGLSDVKVEFSWATEMDFAAIDVREQIAQIELPNGAKNPILLRFDPAMDPIMRLSLTSDSLSQSGVIDQVVLRQIAEQLIKQRLGTIDGVAAINISGGVEEEIQIDVDQSRAAVLGISLSQIADRLRLENVDITGGSIADGTAEYIVRVLALFSDLEEIREIVVGEVSDVLIRLRDLATVQIGYREQSTISRTNRLPSVEIAIQKEALANTVSVAREVRSRLAEIEVELQDTMKVDLLVVSDQSQFIERSILNVIQAAIIGGVLAVAVLYFFLRRFRVTLVIGLAIPISIIASFFFMFLGNVSLNIMSLGGLSLGIGMLVDSSIVMLESIDRHLSDGTDRGTAAKAGGAEVGGAVVAATLTTIFVFIPVIFVSGIAGQLFVDPALTVTFSLLVSLLVALTLIPMAVSIGLPKQTAIATRVKGASPEAIDEISSLPLAAIPLRGIAKVFWLVSWLLKLMIKPISLLFEKSFSTVNAIYPHALNWVLRHRLVVVFFAIVLMIATAVLTPLLGREMLPEINQGSVVVNVELPPGSPVVLTDVILLEMQRRASFINSVQKIYAVSGSSPFGSNEARENIGQILIELHPEYHGKLERQAISELRSALADIPGAAVNLTQPPLITFDLAVEVRISGAGLEVLEKAGETVVEQLKEIEGLVDVTALVAGTSPEVVISLDRERLAEIGLDAEYVGQTVAANIEGEIPTELYRGGENIQLRVRSSPKSFTTIEKLENLVIAIVDDISVPLAAVASVTIVDGATEIRRVDRQRVVVITGNIVGRDLGSVTTEVKGRIDHIAREYGVVAELSGQWQSMVSSFSSMRLAIFLAIVLTYLIMAAQFESLLHPLIILVAVPFGLVGVVLTLLILNIPVSAITLIGVIMMTGIVVNNAIVLVDFTNKLRRTGVSSHQAIQQASITRLRPILMTTATTVLALVPLTFRFGQGWELRQPLAVTVISGLLFSTFVTLFLIPSIYSLISRDREIENTDPSELAVPTKTLPL